MSTVRDAYDRIVGFQCRDCGGVFLSMWGDLCNGCRDQRGRDRMLREIRDGLHGIARAVRERVRDAEGATNGSGSGVSPNGTPQQPDGVITGTPTPSNK